MKRVLVIGDSPLSEIFHEKVLEKEGIVCERTISRNYDEVSQIIRAFLSQEEEEKVIYLLFDDDSYNVRIFLEAQSNLSMKVLEFCKVVCSMHQSSMGEKVQRHMGPRFSYFNPSEIAAVDFVNSALKNPEENKNASPAEGWIATGLAKKMKFDPLIAKALKFLFSVIFIATAFFKYYLHIPVIDSLYFVITTMTTVGYGDYSLRESGELGKIAAVILMMLSVTSVAIVFALISDNIISRRMELTYGITRYRGKDHVIVIGGGSVGYQVIRELNKRKVKSILIDKTMSGKFSREIIEMGIPFLLGDARNEHLLVNAGLENARAVVCVTQDDIVNMEIGLDVKSIIPERRVVLRIFDKDLANSLRLAVGIRYSHSMSYIAAEKIVAEL